MITHDVYFRDTEHIDQWSHTCSDIKWITTWLALKCEGQIFENNN
jgi:hypothetical protein